MCKVTTVIIERAIPIFINYLFVPTKQEETGMWENPTTETFAKKDKRVCCKSMVWFNKNQLYIHVLYEIWIMIIILIKKFSSVQCSVPETPGSNTNLIYLVKLKPFLLEYKGVLND